MKGLRINYTVYSSRYEPGGGECWDFRAIRGAKKKAKFFGPGSKIIRNFNAGNPATGFIGDWWQPGPFLVWNGVAFEKAHSLEEKKWRVAEECWLNAVALDAYFSHRR